MEDFVTWVDSSKIKQHVMNYNEEVSSLLRLCSYCITREKPLFCGMQVFHQMTVVFLFAEGWLWSCCISNAVERWLITQEDRTEGNITVSNYGSWTLNRTWKTLEEIEALPSTKQRGAKGFIASIVYFSVIPVAPRCLCLLPWNCWFCLFTIKRTIIVYDVKHNVS